MQQHPNNLCTEQRAYSNHVFIGPRGLGDCKSLTGSVLITVVFADEPSSAWTEKAVADYQAGLKSATEKLLYEARRYGAKLSVSFRYLRSRTACAVDYENFEDWSILALKGAGLPDRDQVIPYLKKTFSVKEAPLLFAVNRGGRAFARTQSTETGFEYAVLHHGESDYRHELLHLFGARDYYYPKKAAHLANTHFPGSIMNVAGADALVDPLTAYLIGWTDTLTPTAIRFLDATADITEDDVADAVKQETRSATGTFPSESGTFTGTLVQGQYHGYGVFVWNAGGKYEGDFYHGAATGRGTLTWANGDAYTGDFVNWKMHGRGVYTWPSGDRYEGSFENDVATGHGTYIWSNGTTYRGDVLNWKMHGQGTCNYADGQIQSGRWENGNFIG